MNEEILSVNVPHVIRESSQGYQCFDIADEMLSRREIVCFGEINSNSVNSLILQLRHLAFEDPTAEITMYINSPGGEVQSGLALYDVMNALPCPIRTVCTGIAASMASILFMCGNTRDILEHSTVMIHDPLIAGNGFTGSALSVYERSKSLMKSKEIIGNIIARHTGKTLKEVYKKTEKDTYFNATEAVAFGLADNILTSLS